jgi:hypothetical protein
MTGYTVHTGSNENFANGWDKIFGGGRSKSAQKSTARKSGAAKPKKPAVRKKQKK